MLKIFKELFKQTFCEHSYKFYNTKIKYDSMGYGYNSFEFVCTKCGQEMCISEREIHNKYSEHKSNYNKKIVLGENHIEGSELIIPRYEDCDICYNSPAITLMLREYLEQGIDLKQIYTKKKYSHCEG